MKPIECDIHAAKTNLYADSAQTSILPNRRMLQIIKTFILANCICLITIALFAQKTSIDVQSYELTIEPHILKGSIEGEVLIRFKVVDNTKSITINAGNLEIDEVTGTSILSFRKVDSRVIIELSDLRQPEHEMVIVYHGRPKRGIHFNSELNQAHTVYFTDHWMVCNNSPDDRATFSLQILLPEGMQSIASGKFLGTEGMADKVIHKWEQDYETPSYTYGFVIGTFNKATDQVNDVNLSYHSSELEEHELKKVYKETASMLEFFEQKSGVPYVQDTYAQIVIGTNYQEMSGLSVFSKSYPASVLKDSSEIHLTAHELAHQWWGNMITCKDFGHFWLNEAFAVYMSSAFNEHRFGKEKYLSDISIYKNIYKDLIEKGNDKPLVFSSWEPSRINRNVVYYKGAYVLHLLREKLGDDAFWSGISLYSQNNYGKSVVTNDFKLAMEQASKSKLDDFFDEWVYQNNVGK